MLRGRNSQFLEKKKLALIALKVEFSFEIKVVKFAFKAETFQFNKSKKAIKDVIFLSMCNFIFHINVQRQI